MRVGSRATNPAAACCCRTRPPLRAGTPPVVADVRVDIEHLDDTQVLRLAQYYFAGPPVRDFGDAAGENRPRRIHSQRRLVRLLPPPTIASARRTCQPRPDRLSDRPVGTAKRCGAVFDNRPEPPSGRLGCDNLGASEPLSAGCYACCWPGVASLPGLGPRSRRHEGRQRF
jgi:hypothetical protein